MSDDYLDALSWADDEDGDRDGSGHEPYSLGTCEPRHQTAKALLVVRSLDDELWVPLSVIHENSEVYSMKSGAGELLVQRWWAEREGL